jgi:glycosyltransferase involved in cell wall biosynthesis
VKVVILSKALVRGVYQRQIEELAALGDAEITVISPPAWREGPSVIPLERRFTRGYELIVTPMRFTGHYHVHFYPQLGRLLARLRPDLVHVDEEPYNLATWLALKQSQRLGARRVFYTWQNLERRLPPPFSLLEAASYRLTDGVIAANGDAAAIVRRKGLRRPVWVIPPGVDPALYQPADQSDGGQFTVGFVGRLVPEKGVDDLVRACATLAAPWRLVVVGEGPQRTALEQVVRGLGIADRVDFTGALPSTDVPAKLRTFSVLVLPSRTLRNWREQFGRVLMEAMACAVPVVGSDSGEIPRVIGEAGETFPEGNWEALAATLAALQGDPERRHVLGARGRARVLAHFTQRRIAEQTMAVYQSLFVRGYV